MMWEASFPILRFLDRLIAGALGVAALLGVLLVPGSDITSRFAFLPLGAVIVLLAGLLGTRIVGQARASGRGGPAARLPQAFAVAPLALLGASVAWFGRPAFVAQPGYPAAVAVLVLMFPVLLMERFLAATASKTLPEAQALGALARVVLFAGSAACVLEITAAPGISFAAALAVVPAVGVAATGVEIAGRAAGRMFLPPPASNEARAACASWLAAFFCGGVANPIRTQFGLDFTRSWALAYLRAAMWPMAAFILVLAWGLSGVAVVPLDGRAVYEHLGVPVRVLHPGMNFVLPWPMGKLRAVEFGAVHDIRLISEPAPRAVLPAAAEASAPPSADRLWETPHDGEIALVIASASAGQQSFQTVSADMRFLYRVGLTDDQAEDATYTAADPQALVRAVAGRVITASFAGRSLDEALGGAREVMAEKLRLSVQAELDRVRSGLEMVAVVIEAIHPPAGAAGAYHAVQAAEIAAQAAISGERGNGIVIRAQALQFEDSTVSAAEASAAESVEAARIVSIRFATDRDASKLAGKAFALERYFSALDIALAKAPKTIIDHRLASPSAAVLDLRPPLRRHSLNGKRRLKMAPRNKSFLVLFFKKEPLSFLSYP